MLTGVFLFIGKKWISCSLVPRILGTKEDLRLLPIVTKAMIKKEGIERLEASGIPEKSIVGGSS